jgi:cleavage and polyadenylation specificity factor subunit 4
MQDLLATVDHIKFDLEIAVEQQLGAQPLPFPGMDSEYRPVAPVTWQL